VETISIQNYFIANLALDHGHFNNIGLKKNVKLPVYYGERSDRTQPPGRGAVEGCSAG
jgi:hypothetical protein